MNEIKSRNAILEKIKKIRSLSVKLGDLEDVLKFDGLTEEIKDGIEKHCWQLIKELNKLTSET